MNCLTEETGRCSQQKYIICKDAEAIERMVDSGSYEKRSRARLGRLKRYCQMVSSMNLIGSET